jgi:galactose mutarotase-like enzyme
MTTISQTSWYGLNAWALSTAELSTVVVPALGAKIVSLLDRRAETEWLIGPGQRPVKPVPYGATFTDQDMAGWDEMFPTIDACDYPGPGPQHGTPLPDHGEAWALPWQVTAAGPAGLTLKLQGRALPYELTRTADCPEPALLRLRYTLLNLGANPMPYLWAAHPQFLCGSNGQLILPAEVTEVVNTIPESWGWGKPGTRWEWPPAQLADRPGVRADLIGPPTLKRGRKLFVLPHLHPSWAAVLQRDSGRWVRFEWNPDKVPYLGLWVDEGAFSHDSVAALEPMTGWHDDLALAARKGHVKTVPAGEMHTWTLIVRLGRDGQPRLEGRG